MSAVNLIGHEGKPALEQWFATAGLYKAHAFPFKQVADWAKLLRNDGASFGFDAYCPGCGSRSHFRWAVGGRIRHQTPPASISISSRGSGGGESEAAYYASAVAPVLAQPVFTCARNQYHTMKFFVRAHLDRDNQNLCLTKIGQYPSSLDLVSADLERFNKLLDPQDQRELRSAEMCAAHGLHVAAFTYLRRVFERRVELAHAAAQQDSGWDEAAYQANVHRMDERIQALRAHLPPFLVDHRSAYKILSLGIHQLSEDQCAEGFVALSEGVRLMLQQEIEKRDREATERRASDTLRKLADTYKGG